VWHPFRRKTTGLDQLLALEENNRLLRALLTAHGVKLPEVLRSGPPQPRRTEKDITVLTRSQILDQQLRESLKGLDDPRSPDAPPTSKPLSADATSSPTSPKS
jgi:hypothetical protein